MARQSRADPVAWEHRREEVRRLDWWKHFGEFGRVSPDVDKQERYAEEALMLNCMFTNTSEEYDEVGPNIVEKRCK